MVVKEEIRKHTSYNTAYTAYFVRPNFGYAETSYMLETLTEDREYIVRKELKKVA
jgi:hypothetical protein